MHQVNHRNENNSNFDLNKPCIVKIEQKQI